MTFSHTSDDCPEAGRFRSHIHNDYEFFYFIKGDADYVIGSAVYRMKKNTLLLIKPRTYHHLRVRSTALYERYVINFSPEDIAPSLLPFLDTADSMYEIPENSHIHHFFEGWGAAEEDFSEEELTALIGQSIVPILLFLKHQPHKVAAPIKQNTTLEAILNYIDEHPTEAITAESLSARFFVSISWIVHIFQKHLGFSLMQYITKKKMLYAQQLIRAGQSPTDVAVLCGFDNYPTFYRQYRKILLKSPREDKR